ncbi:MAG: DUF6734 family protein [Isosphaeraceae bacterium]
MRAVWSFWSRPFRAHKGTIWCKPLHHLLAWGLSVQAARRHYPDTVLITDRLGKRLLVDRLGLPFTEVSTELERLNNADTDWWALGKLVAYSLQDRPFIHIDNDVFLWKPLSPALVEAPVLSQCPEHFPRDVSYGEADIDRIFAESGSRPPVEWEWARSRGEMNCRMENCGILGGSSPEFLRYYALTAINWLMSPDHALAWSRLWNKRIYTVVVEQFLLSACLDYHRHHPGSPFRGVRVKYLFPSWDQAYLINHAARAGYTHLISGAKSNPTVGRRLEERVRREDPYYFRRCEKVVAEGDPLR